MILSSRLVTMSILRLMLHLAKKARKMCFDADVFNPLTFTEEAEKGINVKDI